MGEEERRHRAVEGESRSSQVCWEGPGVGGARELAGLMGSTDPPGGPERTNRLGG